MKKTTLLLTLTTLVCKPMKTILQPQCDRAFRLGGTFLAAFAACFAVGLAATHASASSVQPLLQGKCDTSGYAYRVAVSGNYAYACK